MSKIDLENQLEILPELVSKALENWRTLSLKREKTDALLHIEYKANNPEKTASDIKAYINANDEHYQAMLLELKAEAEYNLLNDRMLSAKKLASLRTAF